MRRTRIVFTADSVRPEDVRKATCVVIDVLRASTTIITALANGCPAVYPTETPEQAREIARKCGCLLGGERDNRRIEGFDFGNSPLDYSPDKVMGRPIAFTTTNGTRAIRACAGSDALLVSSFVNGPATAALLNEAKGDIFIVCAGSRGEPSLEDTVCGGMLLEALDTPAGADIENAILRWRTHRENLAAMMKVVSEHGRDLAADGFEADIDFAAQVGRFDVVAIRKGDAIVRRIP